MFPGAGTLINVLTIISGASLGVLVGNRMNSRTRTLLTDVLGLVTLLGAGSALIPLWSDRYVQALPKGWTLLVILGSLLIGGLIGSALKLEDRLDKLGETLRVKFKASSDSPFVENKFITYGYLSRSIRLNDKIIQTIGKILNLNKNSRILFSIFYLLLNLIN